MRLECSFLFITFTDLNKVVGVLQVDFVEKKNQTKNPIEPFIVFIFSIFLTFSYCQIT